jgi:hypothetical protein
MPAPGSKFHSYLHYREPVAPLPEVITIEQRQWLVERFRRELLELDANAHQVTISGLGQIPDFAVQLFRVQDTAIVAFWMTNLTSKDDKADRADLRALSVFLTGLDDAADVASLEDARQLSIDGMPLPVPLSFWRTASERPKPMMATWFIALPQKVPELWESAMALGEAFFGSLGLLEGTDAAQPSSTEKHVRFRIHVWSARPVMLRPVNPLNVAETHWLFDRFRESLPRLEDGPGQLRFPDRDGNDRFAVLLWSFGGDALRAVWLHEVTKLAEHVTSATLVAQSVLLRGSDPGNDLRAIAAARTMRNPQGDLFPAPPEQWEKIQRLPRPLLATLFPGDAAQHAIEWHASQILARAFFGLR